MPDNALEPALQALYSGQVIGLPTDTVYGIGADPMQRAAVARLFEVKERPEIMPIPILAASIEDLRPIAVINADVAALADSHWPGALTLILRRVPGTPDWVGDPKRDTVGIRIPDHPLALELLAAFGPLAVTSANRSGADAAVDAASARADLGDSISVYLAGAATGGAASTVVDLSGDRPRVLREGPVGWALS